MVVSSQAAPEQGRSMNERCYLAAYSYESAVVISSSRTTANLCCGNSGRAGQIWC